MSRSGPGPRGLPDSWGALEERITGAEGFSEELRSAGIWALRVLQSYLGRRPWNWSDPDAVPAEIAASWFSLAGMGATIRLALAFSRLKGVPGLAGLADTIARTRGPENLASPMLQLLQGALARSAGFAVSLEPLLEGAENPADLEIVAGEEAIGVEAFALLMDKRTLDASEWAAGLRPALQVLGSRLGVDFEGSIEQVPDADEEASSRELLMTHLHLLGRGLSLPALEVPGISLRGVPADGGGGACHIRMPVVSFGERISARLRRKAVQTESSGVRWLSLEDFDPLWHLTEFGAQPLAVKAEQIAGLIRAELEDAEHLLGVTFSDGAAMMRPDGVEETIEGKGHTTLVRRCDAWRLRESVIITLRAEGGRGAKVWRRVLDAESGWTARELARNDLAVPRELVGATG